MCGIFGQLAKNVKDINIDKIKILGILNETRGGQSCGITLDSKTYHGYQAGKVLFRDFAPDLVQPEIVPIVFGHTRKSSVGIISKHNTHPFGFGHNKALDSHAFIGAHNGTLTNYEDLAEKYGIAVTVNTGEIYTHSQLPITRKKIDSELFLEMIYRNKNYDALREYSGGAALVFTNTKTNEVYLFSGASKKYDTPYYADKEPEIERPIHVYVESKNNMYFSSEAGPLYVIGGDSTNVFQLEGNVVYTIKDGDFLKATRTLIKRAPYHKPTVVSRLREISTGATQSSLRTTTSPSVRNGKHVEISTPAKSTKFYRDVTKLGAWEKYEELHYYKNFRLHCRGVAVTGAYVFVENYGYFKVGNDLHKVAENFQYLQWMYVALDSGELVKASDPRYKEHERVILFKDAAWEDAYKKVCLFVDGFMLKEVNDFRMMVASPHLFKTFPSSPYWDLQKLSIMTVYPVIDTKTKKVYFDGNLATCILTELAGFEYNYRIQDGIVVYQMDRYTNHLKALDVRIKAPRMVTDIAFRDVMNELAIDLAMYSEKPLILESVPSIKEQEDEEFLKNLNKEIDISFVREEDEMYSDTIQKVLEAWNSYNLLYDKTENANTINNFFEDVENILSVNQVTIMEMLSALEPLKNEPFLFNVLYNHFYDEKRTR